MRSSLVFSSGFGHSHLMTRSQLPLGLLLYSRPKESTSGRQRCLTAVQEESRQLLLMQQQERRAQCRAKPSHDLSTLVTWEMRLCS